VPFGLERQGEATYGGAVWPETLGFQGNANGHRRWHTPSVPTAHDDFFFHKPR